MKTPLALYNLWHQGVRTGVSVGGVAFALLLVFMQLGFMGAVSHTATNVLQRLDFDIVLRARDYLHLYEPGQVDRKWLRAAENTRGVQAVRPFWITVQNWRKLPTHAEMLHSDFESQYLPIAVMAFDPRQPVFKLEEVARHGHRLTREDAALLDDSTQRNYGPLDGRHFTSLDLGRETEIGGRRFEVVGLFELGTGLAANGAVITGQRGFARIAPWDVRQSASLGLVQLDPREAQSPDEVADRLRARLETRRMASAVARPRDGVISWLRTLMGADGMESNSGVVDVLTKDQALAYERFRWLWQTPIGLIFQLGVILALLVGAAIVYMVLATDVANRLPEYATLLAMGYSRKYLASIVMTQAIVLSGLGFLLAWLTAELLYRLTSVFSNIPLTMDGGRVVLVGLLGLLMCCLSGLLALRKLWKAEPASLF